MYDNDYMLTHDIDWFFYAEPFFVHAASNQGLLPSEINKESNVNAQFQVSHLPAIYEDNDIEVNYEYIERRLMENESPFATIESYKRTFVLMAKKGFFSFDRDLKYPEEYIWIARPKKRINVNDLPISLFKITHRLNKLLENFKVIGRVIHVD